ncbi:hypothetical protein [Alkalicoccus luteus]|uniref:hypothetical protein n=1 Tax=Alkalicoccus luteus TaxID=1237094 RepID=UPI004033F40B
MIRMAAVTLLLSSLFLPGCLHSSVPEEPPQLSGTVVDHQHGQGRIQIRINDEEDQQLVWLIEHLDSVILSSEEEPLSISSIRRGMEVNVWIIEREELEGQPRAVIDTMIVYDSN